MITWAGASRPPAPGTSRAGPCTGRGEGVHEQPMGATGPPRLRGHCPCPGPGLRSALPGRPKPACAKPRCPAPGGPRMLHDRGGDQLKQRREQYQLPGCHATFQCLVCSPGSSPGSRVQSSRGAVREMQLRFLRTLLRMVPTPPPLPPPPPPCRFRHLPPRRREPVSLSCRIRERPGLQCNHRPLG